MHTASHRTAVTTLTAHDTGFPTVLVTAHAYDSEVDKSEGPLKSCLQERTQKKYGRYSDTTTNKT